MGENEWTEVWHRKNRYDAHHPSKAVTTFYVGNLPSEVSSSLLCKAFQSSGSIKVPYVARKRDVRGNVFGFIRFEGVSDIPLTLSALKRVRILGVSPSVFLARFDKQNRRFPLPPQRPTSAARFPDPPSRRMHSGISYKDVVFGVSSPTPSTSVSASPRSLSFDGPMSPYVSSCLSKAVIVVAPNLSVASNLSSLDLFSRCPPSAISHLWGLSFLIEFENSESAVSLINLHNSSPAVFASLALWSGQSYPPNRLVWIRIHGAPIQVRDRSFYDSVAASFGKVIVPSDFAWPSSSSDSSRCCVLSSFMHRIDEKVHISWQGSKFPVWISEIPDPLPSFSCALPPGRLPEPLRLLNPSPRCRSSQPLNLGLLPSLQFPNLLPTLR